MARTGQGFSGAGGGPGDPTPLSHSPLLLGGGGGGETCPKALAGGARRVCRRRDRLLPRLLEAPRPVAGSQLATARGRSCRFPGARGAPRLVWGEAAPTAALSGRGYTSGTPRVRLEAFVPPAPSSSERWCLAGMTFDPLLPASTRWNLTV